MKTIQVLMRIFLVIGAFTLAGAASLSRTSDYLVRLTIHFFQTFCEGRSVILRDSKLLMHNKKKKNVSNVQLLKCSRLKFKPIQSNQ